MRRVVVGLAIAVLLAIVTLGALGDSSENEKLQWTIIDSQSAETIPRTSRLLRVSTPVRMLVVDGWRAAFATSARDGEVEILTWDVRGDEVSRINPFLPAADAGRELNEIAAADGELAWIDTHWAPRSFHVSMLVVSGRPVHGVDRLLFEEIGNLHGGDGFFMFNTWKAVSSQKRARMLWRAAGEDVEPVRSGHRAADVIDVDGQKALLAHADGVLEVVAADGATIGAIDPAIPLVDPALDGAQVVGLSEDGLTAYDVPSGRRVRALPVERPLRSVPRLEDVEGGLAVYVAEGVLHVVRLADGRRYAVRPAGLSPTVRAQLDSSGLYYSYNDAANTTGTVVFVPLAEVNRSLAE